MRSNAGRSRIDGPKSWHLLGRPPRDSATVSSLVAAGANIEGWWGNPNPEPIGYVHLGSVAILRLQAARLRRRAHFFVVDEDAAAAKGWCEFIDEFQLSAPTVAPPSTWVASTATLGAGVMVGHGCVIEDNCAIGDFAIIGNGVVLGEGCTIGRAAHIGSGAIVFPGEAIEPGLRIPFGYKRG